MGVVYKAMQLGLNRLVALKTIGDSAQLTLAGKLHPVLELTAQATQLSGFGEQMNKRLVNWGYIAAHHALPFIPRLTKGCVIKRTAYCKPPFELGDGGFLSGAAQCSRLKEEPRNCPDY
jgi:hypothetical protein